MLPQTGLNGISPRWLIVVLFKDMDEGTTEALLSREQLYYKNMPGQPGPTECEFGESKIS
jgi:hypothetical protein